MSKIMLAPMEGVVDANMRQLLTSIGGIDSCVTEFIRITGQPLPERDLLKKVPELLTNGSTKNGVPVIVQFLGSDPQMLAYHSQLAVKLGAQGIDLNFGCPSKTVNKHKGGAVLLDEPGTIYDIIKTVRQAVPQSIPVTAKMRLGNKDKSLALENAHAIAQAGASQLVVHARTKIEGYRPPAHWQWIRKIAEAVSIPVVANGDIWDWQDYQKCKQVSGCADVMIGRGILANPALAYEIKQKLNSEVAKVFDWADTVALIIEYYENVQLQLPPPFVSGRVKQWLNMMRKQNSNAQLLFEKIKIISELDSLTAALLDAQKSALRARD
ncbi:MAG: nifR3/Smm1 family protein [Osedax symbiont Rs1]|nr:MAG: nifR3/Smm1 family protein [Osedax symbiont Rs1]